jgi:hypothetical protein
MRRCRGSPRPTWDGAPPEAARTVRPLLPRRRTRRRLPNRARAWSEVDEMTIPRSSSRSVHRTGAARPLRPAALRLLALDATPAPARRDPRTRARRSGSCSSRSWRPSIHGARSCRLPRSAITPGRRACDDHGLACARRALLDAIGCSRTSELARGPRSDRANKAARLPGFAPMGPRGS